MLLFSKSRVSPTSVQLCVSSFLSQALPELWCSHNVLGKLLCLVLKIESCSFFVSWSGDAKNTPCLIMVHTLFQGIRWLVVSNLFSLSLYRWLWSSLQKYSACTGCMEHKATEHYQDSSEWHVFGKVCVIALFWCINMLYVDASLFYGEKNHIIVMMKWW